MDSLHSSSDSPFEDSRSLTPRSRASSGVSSTQSLFNDLQLAASSPGSSLEPNLSTLSRRLAARSPYLNPVAAPQSLVPNSVSQSTPSAFPQLSEDLLSAAWFNVDTTTSSTQDAPLLRVDAVEDCSHSRTASSSIPPQSASMSAVATLQFDPVFSMGNRSSYGWPVLDSGNNNSLLGHDLSSYGSEASLTPPSGPSSVTASPPRNMSAEQRELRRQRDQARRDTKKAVRIRRATGSSYGGSPPVTMADMASPTSLPVYTTGPTQISLLTEPTNLASTSSYSMPTYATSLPTDPQTQPLFSAPYQPHAASYLGEYQPAYTTTPPSLPSQYGRTAIPHDQQSMMYSAMPVLGGGPGGMAPPAPSSASSPPHSHHEASGNVRVVGGRPKPQCWEHGCNGRQFSTFSNLLRHQREKSGQAAKAVCPNCGAEFTRTTARNGHLQHDKCKQRRST
ncbi:hypothetical protein MAPG_06349 [Magnaporthiopsis poae ATCC 64411]|uniref:C2H2-type domain-containing protein n=1 Tax=Magnaporthiopsis poae (strain ATCC 64411 / 73-15) TaxID=644358 RepID=A0A0C4E1T0_MAGP6|nr:hypothetical protein MAPG_06349 [Magnaporthiopsis poae ATCC 64411]